MKTYRPPTEIRSGLDWHPDEPRLKSDLEQQVDRMEAQMERLELLIELLVDTTENTQSKPENNNKKGASL